MTYMVNDGYYYCYTGRHKNKPFLKFVTLVHDDTEKDSIYQNVSSLSAVRLIFECCQI